MMGFVEKLVSGSFHTSLMFVSVSEIVFKIRSYTCCLICLFICNQTGDTGASY